MDKSWYGKIRDLEANGVLGGNDFCKTSFRILRGNKEYREGEIKKDPDLVVRIINVFPEKSLAKLCRSVDHILKNSISEVS